MGEKNFLGVEWGELGKFAAKLAIGDLGGAAQGLTTPRTEGGQAPPEPEPSEGDPPCKRTCDGQACQGHGFGGMCIFGVAAKDSALP